MSDYYAGRNLLFPTPEALQEAVNKYFDDLEPEEHPTIAGLAVALDCDRRTICNYSHRKDFSEIIARAKTRCEARLEQLLMSKDTYTPGHTFILLNGYNWTNTQNHNIGGQENNPVAIAHSGKIELGMELIESQIERVLGKECLEHPTTIGATPETSEPSP